MTNLLVFQIVSSTNIEWIRSGRLFSETCSVRCFVMICVEYIGIELIYDSYFHGPLTF